MRIIGIDYSMTSPSVCFHEGETWDASNAKFYYIVGKEKDVINDGVFFGSLYQKYASQQERYEFLAQWTLDAAISNKAEYVFIEGYAFGAKGRLANIGENCGVMKQKLWKKTGMLCTEFAPSEIKKHATGSGAANKERMVEAFETQTGIDIRARLGITKTNVWNPISDIADAYHICKLGFERLNNANQQNELSNGKSS